MFLLTEQVAFNEELRVNISALQLTMGALEANVTAFQDTSLIQLVLNITDVSSRVNAQETLWASLQPQVNSAVDLYHAQQGVCVYVCVCLLFLLCV